MRFALSCAVAVLSFAGVVAEGQKFTLEQALSAPYASNLVASKSKGRFAWVENQEGKRNIWVAERKEDGTFRARAITHYNQDDGQDIYQLAWTAEGESVLYVRRGDEEDPGSQPPNPSHDPKGAEQKLWIQPLSGGEPREFAEGYFPVLSPRGTQIAFLCRGEIYNAALDQKAGHARPLFHARGNIDSFAWAPDGHAIAFVSERGDHSFIGIYDLQRESLVYLEPSTDVDASPAWSPDSRQVAFLRVPSHPGRSWMESHRTDSPWSIYVADAVTGKGRRVWKAEEGQGSSYYEIDGTQLFWTSEDRLVFPWERNGWAHLYSIPAQGGEPLLLTPGEFEVDNPILLSDGKTILYSSNQGDMDRRHLWKVPVSGGKAVALTTGTGIEVEPVEAGGSIALLHADESMPARPAYLTQQGEIRDMAPELIPAQYPGRAFVRPQQVVFPAADGLSLHGQLFMPTTASDGKQRPALVFFHGGSRRQMLLGYHSMRYYSNAYAMNQYLASQGYIVLSVNYRSGTGYGLDFREALHYGRAGASEYFDVLGAGNYLRSRKDVDTKRIGVWGGSYGGFMTTLALARASDIFAAGVDMHGVHQWLPSSRWKPSPVPGSEDAALESAWNSSPVAAIDSWKSPVLLIHGDDDRNVPFSQTVMLASLLRKHGIPYEELIFPDEIHGFLMHSSWIAAYKAEADFFERHLLNNGQR